MPVGYWSSDTFNTGANFIALTVPGIALSAGSHTLQFLGTSPGGDTATIIDNIRMYMVGSLSLPSTTAVTLTDGATLELDGTTQTIGSLFSSDPTTCVLLDGGDSSLIVGGNNQDSTFDGMISGSGTFTKAGTGTLTLTAPGTPSVTISDPNNLIIPGGVVSVTVPTVMVGMPLTLTAGVADLYGECTGVSFYLDANGDGQLDSGDTLLATAANQGGYWSATVSTTGWGPSTEAVLAQATFPTNTLHPPASTVACGNFNVTADTAILSSADQAGYQESGGGFSTVESAAACGGQYREMSGPIRTPTPPTPSPTLSPAIMKSGRTSSPAANIPITRRSRFTTATPPPARCSRRSTSMKRRPRTGQLDGRRLRVELVGQLLLQQHGDDYRADRVRRSEDRSSRPQAPFRSGQCNAVRQFCPLAGSHHSEWPDLLLRLCGRTSRWRFV